MSDEELGTQEPESGDPPLTHTDDGFDDAADLLSAVETDAKGRKVVGLDKLIDQRKAAKAAKEEIAGLKAKLAEYQGLDERVQRVMPIAEAVERDPTLAAEIRAAIEGTRQTRPTTDQPTNDAEALEYAKVLGFTTKDAQGNDIYDVARAQRALDIESSRSFKHARPHIEAAAEAAYGMRGEQNLSALYHLQTPSGEPIASEDSIKEVMKESQMPIRMLADPRVARTVGLMAAGLDREKGRTPKAIEPVYFERSGGRRTREDVFTDEDRAAARKAGLTEDDLKATPTKRDRKGNITLE